MPGKCYSRRKASSQQVTPACAYLRKYPQYRWVTLRLQVRKRRSANGFPSWPRSCRTSICPMRESSLPPATGNCARKATRHFATWGRSCGDARLGRSKRTKSGCRAPRSCAMSGRQRSGTLRGRYSALGRHQGSARVMIACRCRGRLPNGSVAVRVLLVNSLSPTVLLI